MPLGNSRDLGASEILAVTDCLPPPLDEAEPGMRVTGNGYCSLQRSPGVKLRRASLLDLGRREE